MSHKYTPGPGFGAISMAEYEDQEQKRIEEENRQRWNKELELKERELQMKSQQVTQLEFRLERMEQSLSRIESTLVRYEAQYFQPLVLKINK